MIKIIKMLKLLFISKDKNWIRIINNDYIIEGIRLLREKINFLMREYKYDDICLYFLF